MTSRLATPRARRGAVAAATVAYAVTLGLGRALNIWAMVGVAAALSLTLCVAVARPRWPFRATARRVLTGLALGAAALALTHVGYPIVAHALPALQTETQRLYAWLDDPPGPQLAAPLLAAAVLAEEWVWRGLLVDELTEKHGRIGVLVLATLAYAAPQTATGTWLLPAVAVAFGLVWTGQRLLTDDLTVPFLTHLVWSLGVFSFFQL